MGSWSCLKVHDWGRRKKRLGTTGVAHTKHVPLLKVGFEDKPTCLREVVRGSRFSMDNKPLQLPMSKKSPLALYFKPRVDRILNDATVSVKITYVTVVPY